MLASLDPRYYTKGATKQRAGKDRTIPTVKDIPDPKLPSLYKVAGVERTFSEWAKHSGISKNTLWSRPDRGPSMTAAWLPGNCREILCSKRTGLAHPSDRPEEPKHRGFVVRGDGIEPPTRGFSIPCSTD
jgi:hypothetical protein